ncbi:MAG: putative bile acid beta-glucosidase [Verrucomicrobia bacterium]|nr:putative bile acid beta-glucosidase [Verrucomicrobiota bacterium]
MVNPFIPPVNLPPSSWPVLKSYSNDHLARIALPVGGVGTGTVSLTGWGAWRHWELMNRPAKNFTPTGQGGASGFFAVRAARRGEAPVTRLLEGPLPVTEWEGEEGAAARQAGLPRFRRCTFRAAYPLAQIDLADDAVPVRATVQVFNPLIPGDAARSSLPVAFVRVVLRNPSRAPVSAAVAATLPNFIGVDGFSLKLDEFRGKYFPTGASGNRNAFRQGGVIQGVELASTGVARTHPAWGTMALATTAKRGVTHRTAWADFGWSDALLDFWDDFSGDGKLEPREARTDTPNASLAVAIDVPPMGERSVDFIMAWHFPNRENWGHGPGHVPVIVGNHYANDFPDAWAVAERAARDRPALERETVAFARGVAECDLPAEVREAALFNLSTLRSQTCFRTADGRFFGWEGCFDRQGSCHGNCTHVWNYEHATANLFPELARTMRETEFSGYSMQDNGHMSFRVPLPLRPIPEQGLIAAADGQMGCLLKLHREWRVSGDTAWLRTLWPRARRALEFAWLPGGWDADQDGVMEGAQHNTMDVEYFGPNPQMASWYLGALRAAEEMARAVGETDFAAKCRELFERGRTWVDAHLFNDDYYEHEVRPPGSWDRVRPGLMYTPELKNAAAPDYQLAAGCLIDQLAGQVNAHFEGLGHLLDPVHEREALRAVLAHNRRHGFEAHFNHMRSFVLGDETALLMASYPRGRRPARPFPYYTEVMTGFEYCVALHLAQEGMVRDALKVVRDIRARYDGRKRNPFDEAECGHHYVRALGSWGLIAALTGFHFSALTGSLTFASSPRHVRWFWSSGTAWGSVELTPTRRRTKVTLSVSGGQLKLRRLALTGLGEKEFKAEKTLAAGRALTIEIAPPA